MAKQQKFENLRVAIVGHFQVGKSTLVNCLLRNISAQCGDTIRPTTAKYHVFDLPNKYLQIIDTPGVNAEDKHTKEMQCGLDEADAVILVVKSTAALSEPLREVVREIAQKHLPIIVVVNSWDDRSWFDGDPTKVKKELINIIKSQVEDWMKVTRLNTVNLEWAAAARGCLPDKGREEKLKQCGSNLENQSCFQDVENFLCPDLQDAFSPAGLESTILSTKFISRLRKGVKNAL